MELVESSGGRRRYVHCGPKREMSISLKPALAVGMFSFLFGIQ
jgi:hypothetical protein